MYLFFLFSLAVQIVCTGGLSRGAGTLWSILLLQVGYGGRGFHSSVSLHAFGPWPRYYRVINITLHWNLSQQRRYYTK
ncbi:hypothetical protein M758_UG087100 [Ceratodon purpureus]|nr:hypothetical protein M758_UG087100 [Ceratodon purpureus]